MLGQLSLGESPTSCAALGIADRHRNPNHNEQEKHDVNQGGRFEWQLPSPWEE